MNRASLLASLPASENQSLRVWSRCQEASKCILQGSIHWNGACFAILRKCGLNCQIIPKPMSDRRTPQTASRGSNSREKARCEGSSAALQADLQDSRAEERKGLV